jgi:hypothetical protein
VTASAMAVPGQRLGVSVRRKPLRKTLKSAGLTHTALLHALCCVLVVFTPGKALEVALVAACGVVCAGSPSASLAFLIATTVIPGGDSATASQLGSVKLTNTSIGAVCSVLCLIIRHRRLRIPNFHSETSVFLGLLVAWLMVSAGRQDDWAFVMELSKCLAIGLIALLLHELGGSDISRSLEAFVCGASTVVSVLVLGLIGFSISTVHFVSHTGYTRLALPRQDPNASSYVLVALLAACCGVITLRRGTAWKWWYRGLLGAALIGAIGTQSRGGFIGLLAVLVAAGLRRPAAARVSPRVVSLLCILGAGLVSLFLMREGVGSSVVASVTGRVVEVPQFLLEKGLDTREVALSHALEALTQYPLTGPGLKRYVVANQEEGREILWSHNTFVDYGLSGGWPVLCLFCLLVASPMIRGSLGRTGIHGFLLVLVGSLAMMLSLSMPTDKLFWITWFVASKRGNPK